MNPVRRILLADDDQEVRLGVAELLSGRGLEFLHAETGLQAVELAQGERVDAALLDMHMPGCTGIEALGRMRALQLDLPCIVYSGRWSQGLERSVIEAGARACLPKPVQPALLRRAMAEALHLDLHSLWPQQGLN